MIGFLVSEIRVKSLLNRTKIPGLDYSLNPYVGCRFGCKYCFADFMKRFKNEKRPWGEWVYVKINAPFVLEKEVKRKAPGVISMSTVTDPYQPIEAVYRITRKCLEVLKDTPFFVSILTKSTLVLKDLDILSKMRNVEVGMSIAFQENNQFSRILERRIPRASKRFETLCELGRKGVRTWVFFNPVIPGLNDSDESIEWVIKNSLKAGAERIIVDLINPYPSVVKRLKRFLKPEERKMLEIFVKDYPSRRRYRKILKEKLLSLSRVYGFEIRPIF